MFQQFHVNSFNSLIKICGISKNNLKSSKQKEKLQSNRLTRLCNYYCKYLSLTEITTPQKYRPTQLFLGLKFFY